MQLKKGHLIIILAVGLILVNILMNLRSKPAGPVINREVNVTSDMQTIKDDGASSSAAGTSSSGITILGARLADSASVAPKKNEEVIVREKPAVAIPNKSSASVSVSSKPSQDTVTSSPAGITVLGKQPSQKQKEDMNAKGVVLY